MLVMADAKGTRMRAGFSHIKHAGVRGTWFSSKSEDLSEPFSQIADRRFF
jgi:hypothetical protein